MEDQRARGKTDEAEVRETFAKKVEGKGELHAVLQHRMEMNYGARVSQERSMVGKRGKS